MAKMSMTRVRSFIAAIFALVLVVVLAAFGAAALDMDIPLLSNITNAFGF